MAIDMEHFKETCRRLVKSSIILNEATDLFNGQIVIVENAIKSLNLGLTASVPFGHDFASLAHTKGKQGWGLYIRTTAKSRFGEYEWKFNDAPRSLRISAVEAIPNLLIALGNDANDLAKEMEDASIRAKEMLKGIQ